MKNRIIFLIGIATYIFSFCFIVQSFYLDDNILLIVFGICNTLSLLLIMETNTHSLDIKLKKQWEEQSNNWKKSYLEMEDILLKERKQSDD